MAKPVVFTVDDDAEVLRSVERDLRSRYGADYRVMRADSGEKALDALVQLKRRGDASALFLVDQRMPAMNGVEFIGKAKEVYPDAKRVLLTAYADTDAAIRAINDVQIDHYLLKPWDPPEEKLFPVISDLLDDWQASFRPPFEGVRVIGNSWNPASHNIKEFLARNMIPYQWMDPEVNGEARKLIELVSDGEVHLPAVFLPDGSFLSNPDLRELAGKVGLRTTADRPFYDLLVIGGGPAGLAAAVYGASEGLKTLVVERSAPGGQAGMSSRIENYLGFPSGLSGSDLARRATTQARRFGVEILSAQEAVGLSVNGPSKLVTLGDGTELGSRSLLIATGVSYRQLEAPGVEKLTGAGVFYGAAMTEGEMVIGKDVYIVGGANSAGQAAMYFSRFAENVYMLVRGESLSATMSQYLIDQIGDTANIHLLTETQVLEARGAERLETLILSSKNQPEPREVTAEAIFVFIGAMPHTDWIGDVVARDERGFILSGSDGLATVGLSKWKQERVPFHLESSVPGIFVAGDARHGSVKRVASAVGEGSVAVMFIHQYLNQA